MRPYTHTVMPQIQEGLDERMSIILTVVGVIACLLIALFAWDRFVDSKLFSAMRRMAAKFGPFAAAAGLVVALGAWVLGGGGEENSLLFTGLGVAVIAGFTSVLARG